MANALTILEDKENAAAYGLDFFLLRSLPPARRNDLEC